MCRDRNLLCLQLKKMYQDWFKLLRSSSHRKICGKKSILKNLKHLLLTLFEVFFRPKKTEFWPRLLGPIYSKLHSLFPQFVFSIDGF